MTKLTSASSGLSQKTKTIRPIRVIDSCSRSPMRVETAAWMASASETTRLTISPVERSEKNRWL